MTNSEAILAFLTWLSKRGEQVILSRHNDLDDYIELFERFCNTNNLEIPTECPDYEVPERLDSERV
jgi:hypothetical protein